MYNDFNTTRFLLEISDGFLAETPNIVRENVDAVNTWLSSDIRNQKVSLSYSCEFASLDDVESGPLSYAGAVPVGSIKFCAAVANHQGLGRIPALNIPSALRSEKFLSRQIFDAEDDDALKNLLKSHSSLFVKPGDSAKRFDAVHLTKSNADIFLREQPGPYFVSTMLPKGIAAEWRIFFYRNRVIAARPYTLDEWTAPDKKFVREALDIWGDKPPAGTLDIAILTDGANAVIETHPFIACGLYGFEGEYMLKMLREAWHWLAEQSETLKRGGG